MINKERGIIPRHKFNREFKQIVRLNRRTQLFPVRANNLENSLTNK